MQSPDWPELATMRSGELKTLRGGATDVMKGFYALALAAGKQGALDTKTK